MSIKKETLLVGVLCLFGTIPAFADTDWLLAQTDKDQYRTGQDMEISGFVMDGGIPEIGIKIYDPDNNIVGAYNVELELGGSFTKTVSLDSPSYDQSGLYLVEFEYDDQVDDLFFEVIGTPKPTPAPTSNPNLAPEVLMVTTDKSTYRDNEFITISGLVSDIGDPTILIGIFDPDNLPTGFYMPQINSDSEFEVSFLAKNGVNFKKTGTYTIKANYGTSKITTTFGFTDKPLAQNNNPPADNSNNIPSTPPPQIVLNPAPKSTNTPTIPKQVTPKVETSKTTPVIHYSQPIPAVQNSQPAPVVQNIEKTRPEQNEPDLSPQEKEIGEVLNRITLECGNSEYSDSIIYGQGMGPALMRLCNYDQAVTYFEQAVAKDPYNPEILTNLGSALAKQGKFDEALQNYDLALKKDPNLASALNNKANTLAEIGNLREAVAIYNKILDQDPSNQIVRQNLQKASEDLVQYEKIQAAKEAVSVNLDDSVPKIESTKVNYDKASFDVPKPGIIENIGNIFAGIFGFWK